MSTAETLIIAHLDTWTSAIKAKSSAGRGGGKKEEFYGIKKLRELILKLAVRGLLVPQDSTEPAALKCLMESNSGLLEFEKTPGQPAPSGWLSLPLGCIIASNLGGGTPSKSNPNYWGGDIPWASVKDIQTEKFIDSTIDSITAEGLKNSSSNLIPPNRLLIVTRMGLGKLAINKCAMAINQDLRAIEPISALDLDYGYLLFKTLNLVGTGMTVKGVKVKELHSIRVLLPPLAEQHRIVAKVDELMALCDQLEQQQEDNTRTHATLVETLLGALMAASERGAFAEAWLRIASHFDTLFTTESSIDQLKQTILQLAVMGKLVDQDPADEPAVELYSRIQRIKEDLIREKMIKRVKVEADPTNDDSLDIPPGWMWTRLGNTFDVRDGTHDTPRYTNVGFPLITSKNIYTGKLVFDGAEFISEEDHRKICERSKVDRGDILFAMIGSIGNPTIVDTDRAFSIKNVALFKYFSTADSNPRFLLLYLNHVAEKMKLQSAGGVQSFVSLGFLRNYLFPLPPLTEQGRIVAKVDELMALCDRLKARLQSAQATQLHLAETLVEAAIH